MLRLNQAKKLTFVTHHEKTEHLPMPKQRCISISAYNLQIVFGSHGVLKGITNGKCYVEMSTIDEDTIQDIAEVT